MEVCIHIAIREKYGITQVQVLSVNRRNPINPSKMTIVVLTKMRIPLNHWQY